MLPFKRYESFRKQSLAELENDFDGSDGIAANALGEAASLLSEKSVSMEVRNV